MLRRGEGGGEKEQAASAGIRYVAGRLAGASRRGGGGGAGGSADHCRGLQATGSIPVPVESLQLTGRRQQKQSLSDDSQRRDDVVVFLTPLLYPLFSLSPFPLYLLSSLSSLSSLSLTTVMPN